MMNHLLKAANLTPAHTIRPETLRSKKVKEVEFVFLDESCRMDSLVAGVLYLLVRGSNSPPSSEVILVLPKTVSEFEKGCVHGKVFQSLFEKYASCRDLFAFKDTHSWIFRPNLLEEMEPIKVSVTCINYTLQHMARQEPVVSICKRITNVIKFDRCRIAMPHAKPSHILSDAEEEEEFKLMALPKYFANGIGFSTDSSEQSFVQTIHNVEIDSFIRRLSRSYSKATKGARFYHRHVSSFSITSVVYRYLYDHFQKGLTSVTQRIPVLATLMYSCIMFETHRGKYMESNDYWVQTHILKAFLLLSQTYDCEEVYATLKNLPRDYFTNEENWKDLEDEEEEKKKEVKKEPEEGLIYSPFEAIAEGNNNAKTELVVVQEIPKPTNSATANTVVRKGSGVACMIKHVFHHYHRQTFVTADIETVETRVDLHRIPFSYERFQSRLLDASIYEDTKAILHPLHDTPLPTVQVLLFAKSTNDWKLWVRYVTKEEISKQKLCRLGAFIEKLSNHVCVKPSMVQTIHQDVPSVLEYIVTSNCAERDTWPSTEFVLVSLYDTLKTSYSLEKKDLLKA